MESAWDKNKFLLRIKSGAGGGRIDTVKKKIDLWIHPAFGTDQIKPRLAWIFDSFRLVGKRGVLNSGVMHAAGAYQRNDYQTEKNLKLLPGFHGAMIFGTFRWFGEQKINRPKSVMGKRPGYH